MQHAPGEVGRVQVINRYPVKSMQGEQLDSVRLDSLGIAGDRRFALRDITTGKIVSAKLPKLGIPLLTCAATTDGQTSDVTVMVGNLPFPVLGCDVVLSELLGRAVRMEAATTADEVYDSEWPEIEGLALSGVSLDLPIAGGTGKGTFADLAALHLLTTSSIATIAKHARTSTVRADRFRPSILIDSGTAADGFVENDWVGRTATIGEAVITFGAASPRCIMTTLPQGDLGRDPRVLQTIAMHNRRDYGGFGDFACLGIYAEVTEPGMIRTGDAVTLVD
jgi:uncharacterized protein